MTTIREAAFARRSGVRAPGDRPSKRRNREASTGPARATARLHTAEIRGIGDPDRPLVFDGFASITGEPYEMYDFWGPYDEIVHVGAFAETLARDDLDVPLVLGHDSMRRIARTVRATSTLHLDEVTTGDRTGLHVLAPNLDREDPDVAYVAPKLASGLFDEMSFRFMITSGRWSDDWSEYHIHSVDLHRGDVSIVGYGANPMTEGSGLRASTTGRSASWYRALIDTA